MMKKDSLFLQTLDAVRNNYKMAGITFMIDLMFIASIYLLHLITTSTLPTDPEELASTSYAFPVLLVIVFIQLFLYSFGKYGILYYIKSLHSNARVSFANLWKFFALNIILGLSMLSIVFILNLATTSMIQEQFIRPFYFILNFIIVILFYIILNVTHFTFDGDIKNALVVGPKKGFKDILSFLGPIIIMLIFVSLNSLLLYYNKEIISSTFYGVVYVILFMAVIAFNRLYFYTIMKNVSE